MRKLVTNFICSLFHLRRYWGRDMLPCRLHGKFIIPCQNKKPGWFDILHYEIRSQKNEKIAFAKLFIVGRLYLSAGIL